LSRRDAPKDAKGEKPDCGRMVDNPKEVIPEINIVILYSKKYEVQVKYTVRDCQTYKCKVIA
jgi:hypothetical protein